MENIPEETKKENTTQAAEQKFQLKPELPKQDDLLFYNVMPKGRVGESIVAPKVNVVETAEEKEAKEPSVLSKYKWKIVLSLILLAVLGLGGWYGYRRLSQAPVENILVGTNQKTVKSENDAAEAKDKITTPREWQLKYFGSEVCKDASLCSDGADPDRDGLTNLKEQSINTDPNNADSDQDGLADGDEFNVFQTNPLKPKTQDDPKYNDGDYVKGGYDVAVKDKRYTSEQISQLSARMKEYNLHQPTITTIGVDVLLNIYKFTSTPEQSATSTPVTATPSSGSKTNTIQIDQSPEARADRDSQRTSTIKNILVALAKYHEDNKTYPETNSFTEMLNAIKPYNRVATKPVDPINSEPYVYSYASEKNSTEFTLSFYSETAGLLIKKHAADAVKEKTAQEAAVNDDKRKEDLETMRSALLLYSSKNVSGNADYIFPTEQKYKTALVPTFISSIPKDPVTLKDYEYKVSAQLNAFTLKAALQSPPAGNTGYICNHEDECTYY